MNKKVSDKNEPKFNKHLDLFLFFFVTFVLDAAFGFQFFLNFGVNFDSWNIRNEKTAD